MVHPSGLGIGAIAGIAVGGTVAALMVLGILLRCCYCRDHDRKRRRAEHDFVPSSPKSHHISPWEKSSRPKVKHPAVYMAVPTKHQANHPCDLRITSKQVSR